MLLPINEGKLPCKKLLLIFAAVGFVFFSVSPGLHAQDCGPAPSLPTSLRNDESLKGQLQGQADLLSKLVGKADLSGQVEAARRQIYQSSDQFFAAQRDAYLSYLFCSIIMKDKSLSTGEKLKALDTFRRPISEFRGTLRPGHDPNPSGYVCRPAPDAIAIFFGKGLVTTAMYRIGILISGNPILLINRNAATREISIDLTIFSGDGRRVAKIINNEFTLNKDNFYRMSRTSDDTELTIDDRTNRRVLNIRYMNESTIFVTGVLRYGNYAVIMDNDATTFNNGGPGGASLAGGSCIKGGDTICFSLPGMTVGACPPGP